MFLLDLPQEVITAAYPYPGKNLPLRPLRSAAHPKKPNVAAATKRRNPRKLRSPREPRNRSPNSRRGRDPETPRTHDPPRAEPLRSPEALNSRTSATHSLTGFHLTNPWWPGASRSPSQSPSHHPRQSPSQSFSQSLS